MFDKMEHDHKTIEHMDYYFVTKKVTWDWTFDKLE